MGKNTYVLRLLFLRIYAVVTWKIITIIIPEFISRVKSLILVRWPSGTELQFTIRDIVHGQIDRGGVYFTSFDCHFCRVICFVKTFWNMYDKDVIWLTFFDVAPHWTIKRIPFGVRHAKSSFFVFEICV